MLTPETARLGYTELLRESKRWDYSWCHKTVRLAILSDAAVPQLVPLLKALSAHKGVRAEIYLAEHDSIELEVLKAVWDALMVVVGAELTLRWLSPHISPRWFGSIRNRKRPFGEGPPTQEVLLNRGRSGSGSQLHVNDVASVGERIALIHSQPC
ncbi:MAG: hypothetical protein ABSA52_08810 [Candidatus Binatia bacterium]|jgi:hypothetical protein